MTTFKNKSWRGIILFWTDMRPRESSTVQRKAWTQIGANSAIKACGNPILLFTWIFLKKNKSVEKDSVVKFMKTLSFRKKLEKNTT